MSDPHKDYSKIRQKYPDFIKEYDKLKKEIETLRAEKEFLEGKIEKFKDKSEIYENKKAEDFYDVIIKINSILSLAQGWDISMIEKGKKNYDKYKNVSIISIGVIGNENKGKSTILKKISDFDIPTGFSIKTEGLSIKYPEIKEHPNLKIVLLDSAGLKTPVLDFNNINPDNPYEEKFIEKARDKLLTEEFLQNYIIKNSDILLLVFGKLTFEEQKLLEKVKRDMKNSKRKESLLVIHNLKEFERIKQVEDYIVETLLKSSTFKLKKSTKINKAKTESNQKYCNYYFYEPNSEPKIFHLIFAKEGTEAGDYFNKETINYILNKANDITDKQSFDIINSIKDDFCSVSENILEERLKSEDLIIDKDQKIKLKITENKEKKIKLKRCLIDEIGFSYFFSNLYEPKYEYYIVEDSDNKHSDNLDNKNSDNSDNKNLENSDYKILDSPENKNYINLDSPDNKNKKFVINVEIPGDYKDTTIKKSKKSSYTFINIKGKKVNNNDEENLGKINRKENSFNNREFGEFNINIKLDNKIELESKKPEIKKNNGVLSFVYKIEPEEPDYIV